MKLGVTSFLRKARAHMTTETSAGEEVADGMLVRLTRFSYRRRWIMVFGIWLPLLLVLNTVSGFMGIDYHTDFTLPHSETQFVSDALVKSDDPEDAGYTAQIVYRTSPQCFSRYQRPGPSSTDRASVKG